jgi:phage FluMu gp28-like protein
MPARAKELSASPFDLLLPYQRSWVQDTARFKIWLKSRQIGGSLACAFEVVADAIQNGSDWIILSAGERQALEFMEKVHRVARIFCDGIEQKTGKPYRPETKASQIRFQNGARILALPANASTARGYSANLVLDEFAFHENPEEIWRAVYPIITNPLRGQLKLRVISTPAGMNNKFYELWNEAPDFKRHKTSVYDAVDQGLGLNIEELKANLADPDGWAQEFECQFMEHAAQVFPIDLIRSAEDPAASFGPWNTRTPNPLFVGIDIGRRKDLTVAWTLERVAGVLITREITVLENTPFPEQEAILADRVAHARYVAIDSTGIGGPVSEHLAKRLGEYKLEAVNFTNDRKRELFGRAKKAFQSQTVRIPNSQKLRDDLGSIQRIVTPQGLVKFIAARTRDGHADRATALALALHAAEKCPEGMGLSEQSPARVGENRRRHRPMRTRFAKAWRG